jgi:hypothetical protein
MTQTGSFGRAPSTNPLDIVEQIASAHDWLFDRRSDEEMVVQAPGRWCDYSLYFSWNQDVDAVHFTCAFDMRVVEEKRRAIHELLALINERMWLGHFGLWDEEGLPMFRHALPLRGARGPTPEQMEDLLDIAIVECERFYPAFQYVLWGGQTATDAVTMAMIDTVGEA